MKKLTITEFAKKIGVGVATVDRVLNDWGGVSPAMENLILKAARDAGLKRILPEKHRPSWQLEVLLSSNKSFFFEQLAKDFSMLADNLGYRRITLHKTLFSEASPEKMAKHIEASSKKMDALIIFAHESPLIYEMLTLCKSRGVPVITLVADLPGSDRLCHVGIDQYSAGRTSGFVLGGMLPSHGDVVIISGRTQYAVHRQRVDGFISVMQKFYPKINVREPIYSQDERELISLLLNRTLASDKDIVGIYNTGMGNTQVSEILNDYNLRGKVVYVTHELYNTTRQLLEQRVLTLTIDQNTLRHAQLAITLALHYLEMGEQPDEYKSGKVDFMLYTPENYR